MRSDIPGTGCDYCTRRTWGCHELSVSGPGVSLVAERELYILTGVELVPPHQDVGLCLVVSSDFRLRKLRKHSTHERMMSR